MSGKKFLNSFPNYVCYIAYKGTENGNIIFASEDLLDIDIDDNKMSDLGLLVTALSTSVYSREKSCKKCLHTSVDLVGTI